MRAAQLLDYGSADNFHIVDVPPPEPADGEVLIKVAFAGLRWGDVMSRRGIPVRMATPPFVPGQEVAGVIEAVGAGVSDLHIGDRVVAQPRGGGFAEYVAAPTFFVSRVPDGVPLETMLVYRVNLPTTYLAVFEWAKVQEGETVLVHAAAGGVGMLAVQVLKRCFADVTVIGIAGSDDKVAQVLRNGADHAINRRTEDYVERVGAIAGAKPVGFAPWAPPAGVHVVLNGVGGPTLRTDRRVLRRHGRWVLFGAVAGTEPVDLFESSYDSITILPFSMIPFFGTPPMARADQFVARWLQTEALTPPTVHPLDDIAQVQRAMESGETSGKIVFRL